MKVIAIAAAAVLLSAPAFAQVPAIPGNLIPSNVPSVVTAVNNANFAAGITILDVREVRGIPAFNVPGQALQVGIANFLILTNVP